MGLALEKFPDWPAAMNREMALAYTGLSEKLFDQLERTGRVAGKKFGRSGERVYLRAQLDEVTSLLFGRGASDIDDEFEGVGGPG